MKSEVVMPVPSQGLPVRRWWNASSSTGAVSMRSAATTDATALLFGMPGASGCRYEL